MGKKDKDDKQKLGFVLKTPKGTKDWAGADVLLRDRIFTTITDVFRAHGAVALDTPVFELRDVLAGNYGEDSTLIYDLQDSTICTMAGNESGREEREAISYRKSIQEGPAGCEQRKDEGILSMRL